MGTTSLGLRYPEATGLANQLHTRIKELADDTNAYLVSHDVRGVPISRIGGTIAKLTDVPDNDGIYNIQVANNLATIPATAVSALLQMQIAGRCEGNAQCHWYPQYSLNAGGSWNNFGHMGFYTSHNNNNPAVDMGVSAGITVDVRSSRGQGLGLAMSCRNDSGSVAWVHAAFLHWTITFLS